MAKSIERVHTTNLTNVKIIIAFMIGVILASSITVYAATYYAKDISYTRQGTEVSNVQEALNDLYTNQKKLENKKTILKLGTLTLSSSDTDFPISATSIPNYQNLTKDNFICDFKSIKITGNSSYVTNVDWNLVTTYNSSTGIFNAKRGSIPGASPANIIIDVYVYY